jgi:hypothetical protein
LINFTLISRKPVKYLRVHAVQNDPWRELPAFL